VVAVAAILITWAVPMIREWLRARRIFQQLDDR